MTPIERVARAICIVCELDPDEWWKLYRDEAKAALLALSSPEAISEWMVRRFQAAQTAALQTASEQSPISWDTILSISIAAALAAAAQE